ncbi:DUF2239 family protein [Acuticoccus kandeliae]|uniref:DUF2239 family protein n=1 Tax=Acuticoccus kandeliae TaxID=2073160 RepID=UPI000D3E7E44|nr:DUF2239 family protein [Acuticoccus kandeliae]
MHDDTRRLTAFAGTRRIAAGTMDDILGPVRAAAPEDQVLVFDDRTGRVVDLDLRPGSAPPTSGAAQDGPRRRGRPKLGVVAREVTLLPRHWDWLSAQPGGASQALRRLVDKARREDGGATDRRAAQAAAFAFMNALAGDLPRFEAATRALFASDADAFGQEMRDWPADLAAYAWALAHPDPADIDPD